MPTYRRLDYIREALASALRQTYQDFEVIVSDDGASDEIAQHVDSLRDRRVRYRRNTTNLGIAMNNFAAFSEARGKYIASLHDDDVWEPGFLAALVPLLEADDSIAVAFCDHYMMDEAGCLLPEKTESNSYFHKRHLCGEEISALYQASCDRRGDTDGDGGSLSKIGLDGAEYSRRLGGSYDYWLAWLAVRDGKACYYLPERLTRYRWHKSSGSALRGVRNLRDSIYVQNRLMVIPELLPFRREIENGLGVFYGKMALHYLKHRSFWRGRIFLKKAFSLLNRPKNIVALGVNCILVLCKG